MPYRVEIEGRHAKIYGPLPMQVMKLIFSLSGRHQYFGSAAVQIEADVANIRKLKASGFEFDFIDKSGDLRDIEELEKLGTQHRIVPVPQGPYMPRMELHDYQKECLGLGWNRTGYAIFLEMGLGKTAVTIANAGFLYMRGLITGVLIVTKKGVHSQWIKEEIPKHLDPKVNFEGLIWAGKKFTRNELNCPGKLTFLSVNIDSLRSEEDFAMCRDFLQIHAGYNMIVLDESQEIKNTDSTRTKQMMELKKFSTYRRILTGTPMSKDMLDYFSQFAFLDERILGRYKSAFEQRYCVTVGVGREKKIVDAKNVEDFYSVIAPHCYRKTKKEVLKDLPEKNYIQRPFEMDAKTWRHYEELKAMFMTELDTGAIVDVPTAAVLMLRLQQLSCGYLPGGEEGELVTISESRLDCLSDVIEQIESRPIIIWARFEDDIKRIVRRIKETYGEDSVGAYYGKIDDRERDRNKKAFLAGDMPFLAATAASGGAGLNLQGDCETNIYYSNSFKALDRWQSEDRTHRMGMRRGWTAIDLIARRSVDPGILRNLRSKKELSDLSLDDIRQMIVTES